MEIKKVSTTEKIQQEIQLVKGEFTPSQASEIINSLINQKINYHKLEGLQRWERNHQYDQEPLNRRIEELENEKIRAEEFISKIKDEGKNLKINGILELIVSN